MTAKVLTYVEIDIDYCALIYGSSPCTAALGVTGDIKCFNSIATCQDRVNFDNEPITLRFAVATEYLPADIPCIPSLAGVSITPATVSLGKDLGQRASVRATFNDHPWSDTPPGFDKYWTERGYDPYLRGTFWGKFRSRQPYLRERSFRLIRGQLGQTLAEMETRHFLIESSNGPGPEATFTITAKDALKLADGDRAQAPALSSGFLNAAINLSVLSLTLSPAGIGNLEYPSTGWANIGGEEIVSFTRVADVMTIVRGQKGTVAAAHDQEDRVQLCLVYQAESPPTIIHDLLVNYAGIDPAFINLSAWEAEAAAHWQRVSTATISEPTPVATLISELLQQAPAALWWDEIARLLRYQILRAVPTDADLYDESRIIEGSLKIVEQPNSRISQVWTYYALKNPLEGIGSEDNFRSTAASVDLQAETDYGTPAILKIESRWIPDFGRTIATRLNALILSRFRDPPRRFTFDLARYSDDADPVLGGGYLLAGWPLQDETGARVTVPIQITRVNPMEDRFSVEAEELLLTQFDPADLADRVITIDTNTLNVNGRDIHDDLFPPLTDWTGVTLRFIVSAGVIVGSSSIAIPSFHVGDWSDVTGTPAITVEIVGRVQSKGGNGGNGVAGGSPVGQPGGTALYTRTAIDLEMPSGELWGGGGGGGGGASLFSADGGGGGAGQIPGNGGGHWDTGEDGDPGTTEAGGEGGSAGASPGGDGGDPGDPGQDGGISGSGALGGAAGNAIDGDSFVTITGAGDLRGPQIN